MKHPDLKRHLCGNTKCAKYGLNKKGRRLAAETLRNMCDEMDDAPAFVQVKNNVSFLSIHGSFITSIIKIYKQRKIFYKNT